MYFDRMSLALVRGQGHAAKRAAGGGGTRGATGGALRRHRTRLREDAREGHEWRGRTTSRKKEIERCRKGRGKREAKHGKEKRV